MTQPLNPGDEPVANPELEAFLDGTMPDEQAKAFAQRLEHDPDLSAQVALQEQIDSGLRQEFGWICSAKPLRLPDESDAHVSTEASESGSADSEAAGPFLFPGAKVRRWAGLAAMAAALGLALTAALHFSLPRTESATLAGIYHDEVSTGFVPGWVCETEFDFVRIYNNAFQTPIRFNAAANQQAVGLTINFSLGTHTVMFLAYVDDEPVLVFAARPDRVVENLDPGGRGLNLFERTMGSGSVQLYELTPFKEPRLLDQFEHLPDWDEEAARAELEAVSKI